MAPPTSEPVPFVKSGDPLHEFLPAFWQRQIYAAENETPDYRHPALPLARIKKVMKSDPDVKMIAADAPFLLCKACEIFIAEMTARAFVVADSNKRRTLSRADIAKALTKSDQFDFLIDIVPRDEAHLQPYTGPARGEDGKRKKGKAKDEPKPSTHAPPAPPQQQQQQQQQPAHQPTHQAPLLSAPPHRALTLDTAPDFGDDNLSFLDDPNSPIERHGR